MNDMARAKREKSPVELEIERMKTLDKKFFVIAKTLYERRQSIRKRIRELNGSAGKNMDARQLRLFDL